MKKIIALALAAILLLPVLPAFAEERTVLSVENQYLLDVSKPVIVNLKTTEAFDTATFYLDGVKLAEVEDDGSRDMNAPLDLGSIPYLGEAKLSAQVMYDEAEEVVLPVYLVKLSGETFSAFNENFSEATDDAPNPSFNYNTNIEANNSKISLVHHQYGDNNKALEAKLTGSISSKEPFLIKDGLAVADGANITVGFDVYFSTNRAYVKVETRDLSPGKYPTDNGASLPVLTLFKGVKTIANNEYDSECWYSCKVVINTVHKGLEFYLKKEGETEYTLEHSMPEYNSVGLNQIRFCIGSLNSEGGSVILDNISVEYQKEDNTWYAKPTYKNPEGTVTSNQNFSVKNGEINLTFSRKMNGVNAENVKIFNCVGDEIEYDGEYDSENNIYTIKPKIELVYDSTYKIKVSESVTTIDESPRLSNAEMMFKTEKYGISILSCEDSQNGVNIRISNPEEVDGEILAVYIMKDGMIYSVNMTELSSILSEYDMVLTKPSEDYKIYAYIMKSSTDFTVKEAYTND